MVDSADASCITATPADSADHIAVAPPSSVGQYTGLAQAVAALLSPTITAAVDRALAAGIGQLRNELGDRPKRLSEAGYRISDVEDEVQNTFTTEQK